MDPNEFLSAWFKKHRFEKIDRENIEEMFLILAEKTGFDTERQFKRLMPRAIFLSVNREVDSEYAMADYIGRLIESCSEDKRIQRKVQDTFFEVMGERPEDDIYALFLESVKRYNQSRG